MKMLILQIGNKINNKKKIVIRPTTSKENGGGHFFRSLNLAEIFNKNHDVTLIVDELTPLQKKKIRFIDIKMKEINQILTYDSKVDICILDGYSFSNSETSFWKENSNFIVSFDDLCKEYKFADLLISFGNKKKISNGRQIITDIKYAPVSKDCFIKSKKIKIKKSIKNIMINFGLIDSKGLALEILKIISKNYNLFDKINFFIIIGSMHKYQQGINVILKSKNIRYKLLIETDKMYEYLSKSDLVIGAAGVSLLERVSMGIPSITIPTSDNQMNQLKVIETRQGTKSIKFPFIEKKFVNFLMEIAENYNKRKLMSTKAKQIIKENSTKLLSEKIINLYNQSFNHK